MLKCQNVFVTKAWLTPAKNQYNKAQTIKNQYGMAIPKLQITNLVIMNYNTLK